MQCRNLHRQAAAVLMSAELEVKARLGLKCQVWTSTHFVMVFPYFSSQLEVNEDHLSSLPDISV